MRPRSSIQPRRSTAPRRARASVTCGRNGSSAVERPSAAATSAARRGDPASGIRDAVPGTRALPGLWKAPSRPVATSIGSCAAATRRMAARQFRRRSSGSTEPRNARVRCQASGSAQRSASAGGCLRHSATAVATESERRASPSGTATKQRQRSRHRPVIRASTIGSSSSSEWMTGTPSGNLLGTDGGACDRSARR